MGRIQSIHSFSTIDGPGARCVVFLQGCLTGCVFCHNPDAWCADGGEEITAELLVRRLDQYRTFMHRPSLTLSGGEPMCQPAFAREVAQACRLKGWHVALDTSGWGQVEEFTTLCRSVDLVMLSIKHPSEPLRVSQIKQADAERNRRALSGLNVAVWLRYVLIPGLTDEPAALRELGRIACAMPNCVRVQILPFNSLAAGKWTALKKTNPLFSATMPVVTETQIRTAEAIIREVCPKLSGPAGR